MDIKQLLNKIKEYNPDSDTDMIKLAYEFAEKAHYGQKRKSNEAYIQHCLHTALLLAQIKADQTTIIAGLLHDVPEDTERTLDDIKTNFGEDVAFLVEGITKLSKLKYRGVERYRESLRKMFLAMSRDIRVVLIKFCDRLHNLRTLDSLPEEKRLRIAKETMEIYSPIAGLLGVWRLKWQMEDLCFKHLYPEEFSKLEYKYEVEQKVERNQYIAKVKSILGNELKKADISFQIEGRFKHLFSIYQKMKTKGKQFDEIQDVFALRVITDTVENCYKILGIIHTLWKPKPNRIKDYIAVAKPNGYRSLHTTVFGPDGKSTEFQIRTEEMNNEALYGIAAHWFYKQKPDEEITLMRQPTWIKEILDLQQENKDTEKFIKQIKFDIFRDRIFVFSPQGDVFELPKGSTPIDFAYAVHTDIGDKASGALINDEMGKLDQELKNGDAVEILIEKNRKGPNLDWLKFAKTVRAREKIKQNAPKTSFSDFKKFLPRL